MAQHFHALSDLLIRLLGSLAVFSLVILLFMPDIREQKDALRPLSSLDLGLGAGGFRFIP
jgi:competence protein ComGC